MSEYSVLAQTARAGASLEGVTVGGDRSRFQASKQAGSEGAANQARIPAPPQTTRVLSLRLLGHHTFIIKVPAKHRKQSNSNL